MRVRNEFDIIKHDLTREGADLNNCDQLNYKT